MYNRHKKRFWQQMWLDRSSYLMLAPFLFAFTIFTVIPISASVVLSFTDYNFFTTPNFVGLQNYVSLFLNDDLFLIALRNTLLLAFVTGPISFIACFLFAWLINELPGKIRSFMTVIMYAPSISGMAFMVWTIILHGSRHGYVNNFLLRFGIVSTPIQFMQDPQYMMFGVILVTFWMSLGIGFLAFMAGLKTVDPQLYEAASIDGIQNRFQELIYVTLPNMKPQLMFAAVMQIVAAFGAGMVSRQLHGEIPNDFATYTVTMHMHDFGQNRFEMGYASAMAVVMLIVMLLIHKVISTYLVEK